MKIGSAVVGLHIAVLCAFALTQGCVTTESQGSGRGAGAKHKRPFRHEHKGKQAPVSPYYMGQQDPYNMGTEDVPAGSIIDDPGISTYTPPPVVEPPITYPEQTTEVYIVQKGDILSQLAVDFDTTTATLVEMNGLANPDVLYVGQELRVPAGRRSSAPRTTTKSTNVKKGATYTIRKGDTLSGIALAAGVSINDLREVNDIKGDKIMAGDKIYIPSYGKVPSSTPRSTPAKTEEVKQDPVETAVPPVADPAPPMMEIAAPATTGAVADPATPDTPAAADTDSFGVVQEHVVYPGETLDDISRQYGVSKAEIMRLNNIKDETQIRESQKLRIPVSE